MFFKSLLCWVPGIHTQALASRPCNILVFRILSLGYIPQEGISGSRGYAHYYWRHSLPVAQPVLLSWQVSPSLSCARGHSILLPHVSRVSTLTFLKDSCLDGTTTRFLPNSRLLAGWLVCLVVGVTQPLSSSPPEWGLGVGNISQNHKISILLHLKLVSLRQLIKI